MVGIIIINLYKIGTEYEAIFCFIYRKQSIMEVGEGLDKISRVGTLALFQDQVKLLS